MNQEWPMPLLCITLLALLLLPQARPCDKGNLTEDYQIEVLYKIKTVEENITSTLQKSGQNCPSLRIKLPSCTSSSVDEVHSILKLIFRMSSLMPSLTNDLAETIAHSVRTNCPEKWELRPTATPCDPGTGEKKNPCKINRRKMCKIKAILTSMTQCYQVLNSKSQTSGTN